MPRGANLLRPTKTAAIRMPIDLVALFGAWLSGVFGGVHCVAMCGGLATSLGAGAEAMPAGQRALWLNLGRVGGYVLAGALVGGLGTAVWHVLRVDAWMYLLRSAVGAVLVLAALRLWWPHRFGFAARAGNAVWRRLRPWRDRLVPARGPLRPLVLGVFWGWLPCGLSTTLLMAAWLEASAWHGALLMAAFGLGTLPLMTGLSWSGAHFAARLARPAWRRIAALLIACAGIATLAAPWLVHLPAMHAWLQALGCRSLPPA